MKKKTKLHGQSGFTLAETLLAVLILLMVSTIVASGVPVARNAYEKVVLGSNAQVLLSNAVHALRYELGTAAEVTVNGTAITYISASTGARSQISLDNENGIMLWEYYDPETSSPEPRRLVSEASGGTNGTLDKLTVKYESVAADKENGFIRFTNLAVYRNSGSSSIALLPAYDIRVIGSFAQPSS